MNGVSTKFLELDCSTETYGNKDFGTILSSFFVSFVYWNVVRFLSTSEFYSNQCIDVNIDFLSPHALDVSCPSLLRN